MKLNRDKYGILHLDKKHRQQNQTKKTPKQTNKKQQLTTWLRTEQRNRDDLEADFCVYLPQSVNEP